MTRRRRTDVGERPTCDLHPGSKVYVDRHVRSARSGYYQGLAFRCVTAAGKHLIKRSFLPRAMTSAHPATAGPCPQCGQRHADQSGLTVAAGYSFAMLEQGRALVRLGRGETYGLVAKGIRIEALKPRQPFRPACRNRPWLPRGTYPPKPRTTKAADYNYAKTNTPAPRTGPYSKSSTVVQSWVDVFAPPILAAYAPTFLPRVLAMDSKPLKRRAWEADEKTGNVRKVTAGERNGEVMVIADNSAGQTLPILAALEGGKDAESWQRVFRRLPPGDPPFWVVADLDSGIERAVGVTWPTAILFRCEEHLRERMRMALVKDGVSRKVTRAQSAKLGVIVPATSPVKARRGNADQVDHPLFMLIGRSLKSREDWEALKSAVEKAVPEDHNFLRHWIGTNESLVLDQFDLKEQYPDMPKSAGGVEDVLSRVGSAFDRRGEFFSNARRLDLLIGLIRLETIEVASDVRYSEIIAKFVEGRAGAGMDWQDGRDVLGTSSIDDLIDDAVLVNQVATVARRDEDRRQRQQDKIARLDAERAAAGMPPVRTGRVLRQDGGLTYYPVLKGQTVADTPGIRDLWRPEYNDGRTADQVGAGHGKPATWVCTAHEADGHLHIWKKRVIDMCTLRTMCPYCCRRQACPSTSLATLFRDLAKEWSDKNVLRPEDVLPGSSQKVLWKCLQDTSHRPFSQRVSQRTTQGHTCPQCSADARAAARKAKAVKAQAVARRAAALHRGPSIPPVITDGPTPPFDPDEETLSVRQVARHFGRSAQTVSNWITAGRVRAMTGGSDRLKSHRITRTEVERVAAIIGVVRIPDPDLVPPSLGDEAWGGDPTDAVDTTPPRLGSERSAMPHCDQ